MRFLISLAIFLLSHRLITAQSTFTAVPSPGNDVAVPGSSGYRLRVTSISTGALCKLEVRRADNQNFLENGRVDDVAVAALVHVPDEFNL